MSNDCSSSASRLAAGLVVAFILALAVGVHPLAWSPGGDRPVRPALVKAERQPVADLGDGRYLNPIFPGEYPDPSVVRVGADYYMTHTPETASPALLVWHSRDLVNWEMLGPALARSVGNIWAPEIVHHRGRFYIYFPAQVRDAGGKSHRTNFVTTATNPAGPWSEPIDLRVPGIDPGHVADAEGNRYLYLDDGMMARLSEDGLRVTAAPVKVYDGWDYPADWNVECKCLESPKLFTRGGYYYLVSAQGGTAGPSTSHMIVVARSKSPGGPWENMPSNPLLRTRSRAERWWSQGHGTILEAADGTWWVVYHGFENGYRTLGRNTLMLPVEWTGDGWPRIPAGADPGRPLAKPAGENVGHGLPLSDGFAAGTPGWQWRRWEAEDALAGYVRAGGELRMEARGTGPADGALLTIAPPNHSYEAQVEIALPPGAQGGLLLHYDADNYAGIGAGQEGLRTFIRDVSVGRTPWPSASRRVFLKVRNVEHDVRAYASADGVSWTPVGGGFEMSGYHHDTFRRWSSLKIALYAAGSGTVTFRDFRYTGAEERPTPAAPVTDL